MIAKIFGVVFATAAMYAWGFFIWGMNTLPYSFWETPTEPVVAAEVLKSQFPAPGVYRLPPLDPTIAPIDRDPQALQQPPIAFVHIISTDAVPNQDQATMIKGFGIYLLSAAFMCWLMATAQVNFARRVGVAFIAGIMAGLMSEMGQWAWWGISLEWQAVNALYQVSVFLVGGIVLALFMPLPRKPKTVDEADMPA